MVANKKQTSVEIQTGAPTSSSEDLGATDHLTTPIVKLPEGLQEAHEKKVKLLTMIASKNKSQRQSPNNLD